MSDITLQSYNEVWLHADCSDAIAAELNEYFVYTIPGAIFMRRQARFKNWSGKIHLFRLKDHRIYRGLLQQVLEFAESRGYTIENLIPRPTPFLPRQDLDTWIQTLNLPFEVRDYQYAAVRNALDKHRAVIVSATGSGKSLIIYLIQLALAQKTLLIVPTLNLVTQMVNDFRSYGCDESIHPIQAGAEKTDAARIFISTWQSTFDMPAEYFEQFGTVIIDECHLAKASSITGLMEKCLTVPYRFGCTGTLSDTKVHTLQIQGLCGDVHQITTTANLVKKSQLSPILVKMLVLGYPEQMRKNLRYLNYQEEIEFLVSEKSRTEFIVQMVRKLSGCSLILFGRIQHGKAIYERLQSMGLDVHYIAGEVGAVEREDIRQNIIGSKQSILVGSFGTVQSGLNIPGLKNLIFAASSKSIIRVLQSVGRVLRLSEGKSRATVYDIVDDLRIKKHSNFCWRHAEARSKIYANEKFPVVLQQIKLEAFGQLYGVPPTEVLSPPDLTTDTGCNELSASAG
jgi:superfamily II DNA or RNA helicase